MTHRAYTRTTPAWRCTGPPSPPGGMGSTPVRAPGGTGRGRGSTTAPVSHRQPHRPVSGRARACREPARSRCRPSGVSATAHPCTRQTRPRRSDRHTRRSLGRAAAPPGPGRGRHRCASPRPRRRAPARYGRPATRAGRRRTLGSPRAPTARCRAPPVRHAPPARRHRSRGPGSTPSGSRCGHASASLHRHGPRGVHGPAPPGGGPRRQLETCCCRERRRAGAGTRGRTGGCSLPPPQTPTRATHSSRGVGRSPVWSPPAGTPPGSRRAPRRCRTRPVTRGCGRTSRPRTGSTVGRRSRHSVVPAGTGSRHRQSPAGHP